LMITNSENTAIHKYLVQNLMSLWMAR